VPAALVTMVVATIIIGLIGGEATGVHVAGHIPSGLPRLVLPHFDSTILQELAPGALAIVLIGYAEALAAAKAAAVESGGDIDPNQELVAHGQPTFSAASSVDFSWWVASPKPRWPWLQALAASSPTLLPPPCVSSRYYS